MPQERWVGAQMCIREVVFVREVVVCDAVKTLVIAKLGSNVEIRDRSRAGSILELEEVLEADVVK